MATPTTRKEMYLEKIFDSGFTAPAPTTIEEEILNGMKATSIIHLTDAGSDTYTSDKSATDIAALFAKGDVVLATYESKSGTTVTACGTTFVTFASSAYSVVIGEYTYTCSSGKNFTKVSQT